MASGGWDIQCIPGMIVGGILHQAPGVWTEPNRSRQWQEQDRESRWHAAVRNLTWSTATMAALVKRAAEVRLYKMDLSLLPEISGGDTVSSVTSVTAATTTAGAAASDLTVTSTAVASGSQGAQCKIAGGTDNATYQISFTVLTAAGYTLVGIGYLYIDDR
jgi:hypothetical protein